VPVPFVWWISRLCEEFHCLPSAAYREWLDAPDGLIEHLLEARAYAATKAACDRAQTAKDRPTGPMADLVTETEFRLAQEAFSSGSTDDTDG